MDAFDDLDAADSLELPAKAPPGEAARLTSTQISAALTRARRRGIAQKAAAIQTALREPHLGQPEVVADAYAVSIQALIAALTVLNTHGCWVPGCSPSSETTRIATPARRPARTTPHFPDHQGIRQEEGRPGPVHPPRPAHGRGCLKTGTRYDEATAWSHHAENVAA